MGLGIEKSKRKGVRGRRRGRTQAQETRTKECTRSGRDGRERWKGENACEDMGETEHREKGEKRERQCRRGR